MIIKDELWAIVIDALYDDTTKPAIKHVRQDIFEFLQEFDEDYKDTLKISDS